MAGKIKCSNCGNFCLITEMRYSPEERIVCSNCFRKNAEAKAREENAVEKVAYVCSRCHYKFTRNPGLKVAVCPYCSRESVRKLGRADTLVKEAGEEEF